MKTPLVIAFAACLLGAPCWSQTPATPPEQRPAPPELTIPLPTLEQAIDSALANSPVIQFYQAELEKSEHVLHGSRYDWASGIALDLDSKYGRYGGTLLLDDLSLGYGGRVGVNIPLSTFIGKKDRKSVLELDVATAGFKKEELTRQVRAAVIQQYNKVVLQQRLIEVKSKAILQMDVQLQIARKEFTEGIILISELNNVFATHAGTLEQFEVAKSNFKTDYMLLEEMVGVDFRFLERKP